MTWNKLPTCSSPNYTLYTLILIFSNRVLGEPSKIWAVFLFSDPKKRRNAIMLANVKGVFMGATPKSRVRDGQTETSVSVDVYQPESQSNNKTVSIKVPDGNNLSKILTKYKMGTEVNAMVSVSAFNGNMYLTHQDGLL